MPMSPASPPAREAIVLCAAWCRTCDAFQPVVEAMRRRHFDVLWYWVDIEDDADLMGEIDIQTFPTVVLLDAGRPWFAGPVLPRAEVVERMLSQPPGGAASEVEHEDDLVALLAALRARSSSG